MSEALSAYLAQVGRGLRGVAPGRRKLFLKELESHLLDEAEARGLEDEAGMAVLLREKEEPDVLARMLAERETQQVGHQWGAALAGGALLGSATGTLLFFQGFPIYLSVTFGVAHGLAVGVGLFWLRPRWKGLSLDGRLAGAALLGALLAVPLGFTRYFQGQGFILSRLYYGAYTGYLVERHSERRPWWQLAVETLAFTAFMLLLEYPLTRRLQHFSLVQVQKELVFNATLSLAVLAATSLKRALSNRFIASH